MHIDHAPIRPGHFTELANDTVISVLSGTTLPDTTSQQTTQDYGLLEITGTDSAKFLQGQLTCNMQDITPQQSKPGAHCTHKGRMVASFRLLQHGLPDSQGLPGSPDNGYLFFMPASTLPALQKSLGKYIVFSKAKLRDASIDYVIFGISGPHAAQTIATVFGTAPTAPDEQCISSNGIVIGIGIDTGNTDTPLTRFLCITPVAQEKTVWAALTVNATVTDNHYWQWLDIRDGMGAVQGNTIEEFIPQMLNLQLLHGISFTKGCYTGQEIVARMQYRGTLKKGMYRIAGTGVAPSPNDPVFQQDQEQAAGHVVMAENIAADQWEALAVIPHDAIEHVLLVNNASPADAKSSVTVLPLPYRVTVAD